jgi:hypothetical protein
MPKIFPGRFTADIDGPFVVFLIGTRINQLWAVHKWMPVAKAMPPMLELLAKNPAKGLLGVHTWVCWREVMGMQYWQSFEDLENFARPGDLHLQVCKDFNRRVGSDGSVGVWHETYMVNARQYVRSATPPDESFNFYAWACGTLLARAHARAGDAAAIAGYCGGNRVLDKALATWAEA